MVATGALIPVLPVRAAAPTIACGSVLTRNTSLKADVGPCAGDGIVIGADNVTLNLGGHRVFGTPGPGSGSQAGIRLPGRTRVRVVNGTVSDFDAGVFLNEGRSNLLANLTVRDNIGPDNAFTAELGDGIVLFDSASNTIVDNTVTRNGIFDGIGVLGGNADGNVIQGNVVTDTVGPSDGGPAGQGIIVNAAGLGVNEGQTIEDTLIEGNVVRGSGSGGIANISSVNTQILSNVVENNGFTNRSGNGIGVQMGPATRAPESNALVQNNEVHGNRDDGIQIAYRSVGNRIVNNNAAGNDTTAWFATADLNDRNAYCANNVWSANIWGSGGYRTECVTAGGSGPRPQPVFEGLTGYGYDTDFDICGDQLDNDQDGLIDFGIPPFNLASADPDCVPPSEDPNDHFNLTCYDGEDNNGDGLIDFDDPLCAGDGPPAVASTAGLDAALSSRTAGGAAADDELPPPRGVRSSEGR